MSLQRFPATEVSLSRAQILPICECDAKSVLAARLHRAASGPVFTQSGCQCNWQLTWCRPGTASRCWWTAGGRSGGRVSSSSPVIDLHVAKPRLPLAVRGAFLRGPCADLSPPPPRRSICSATANESGPCGEAVPGRFFCLLTATPATLASVGGGEKHTAAVFSERRAVGARRGKPFD